MNTSNTNRAVVDPIQGHVSEDEVVRLNEQRYRSLVLASASTVWVTDANGAFCSPQDSWEAYTGQPWNEHRGWGWSKMLHPEDADQMTAAWRAAVDDPGLFFIEGRLWNAESGEYHFCEVRGAPILNADDTIREWVGTTTDVHHRQMQLRDKTNRAVRESESNLAEAQRIAKIGNFEIDPVAGVVNWSRELFRILGYDPDTTTPSLELFLNRVHPDDRRRVVAANQRLPDGKPVTFEFRLLMPDGSCKHIRDHLEFRFDASGRPIRVIGTVQDVTEQKRAESALRASEEQLRQLNVDLEQRVAARTAELEDKNDELEAFGHSVSHDLRAPLRGMEGFALALQEDYADRLDDEGREYIQHIVDSARRMDALINDLLAYSRISRDQLVLEPVALSEAVRSSLQQLEDEICARDAEVNVEGDLPIVVGHAATVGQIVTNLVSNAIKFTAAGVRPEVRLSAECADNTARFWVKDNGVGIAAKHHQRIFNVFERLHGVETYPGTGIGLAIVSRASRRMNGRCGVESSASQGSRFWVELPLRRGGY